jgi:predicted nucleic acid-binding protein
MPSPTNRWQEEMRELVGQSRVRIIGPVRQEILSGIRERKNFENLKERLSVFPDVVILTADYERAAELFNACRARGIQGSHTDFLICAISLHHDWEIFTTDSDFLRYARIIGVKLYRM